jgi:hypothetical protein
MALSDVKCRQVRPTENSRSCPMVAAFSPVSGPVARGCGVSLSLQRQAEASRRPYPLISLAEARVARDDAKRLLFKGVDPGRAKQEEKLERVSTTFKGIAEEYG